MNTPLAIVGNTLAVLVAATERAKRGLATTVINSTGSWGGYFAGVQADGRRWDAGMVCYEFTSFREPKAPPALASYDPTRRNDVGRFVRVVQDYVAARQSTRVIELPQMSLHGRWLPDLLLANGLDALPQLDCAKPAREELRVAARLGRSPQVPVWHPSRKHEWRPDGRSDTGALFDIDTASRLNHGHVLHEAVFAPFARQVLSRDAGNLAALFHRVPWLPLYWPETLSAWLEGRRQALPPTEFSYPQGACVADLCATLAAELRSAPEVHLLRNALVGVDASRRGTVLRLADGNSVQADTLAWALAPHQGLRACGVDVGTPPETRLPLLLAFLSLPRATVLRDFSVLHVASDETGLYRVNHVSACAGEADAREVSLVVEAHPDRVTACHGPLDGDAATLRTILDDLARLGVVRAGANARFAKLVCISGALPLPTVEGLAAFAEHRAQLLRRLPGVRAIGNSAGPFATSLSDQIVQGLSLAESDIARLP